MLSANGRSSQASRNLAVVLQNNGKLAAAVYKTGIHRTLIWRYATGRTQPNVGHAAKLHRATGGRVPAYGWEIDCLVEPVQSEPAA